MEVKELKKVFIEVVHSNIVIVTFKNGWIIEPKDIKELQDFTLQVVGNNDYVLILDVKDFNSVSSKAKKIMASTSLEKNRKAMAIIIYKSSHRILGNLFVRLNRSNIPTKLFSTKKEALNWVTKHINQ